MFIILTLKIFDRGKKCLLVALILLNGMCLYSKDDWIRWWNYACSLVEKYNFKDVTVTVLKWSLLNQLLHAKLRFLFCSQPDIFNLHTPLPLPSPKKWIIYTYDLKSLIFYRLVSNKKYWMIYCWYIHYQIDFFKDWILFLS